MNGKAFDQGMHGPQDTPRASVWDILLVEDDTELDPELLGAFAAGRLDPQRREAVRQLVARSPHAMQMVSALHEFLEEPEVEPAPAPSEVQPAAKQAVRPAVDRVRSPALLIALAASLLLAVLAGYVAIDRGREVARLDQAMRGMPAVSGSAWVEGTDPTALFDDRATLRGPTGASQEDKEVRTTRIKAVIESVDTMIRQRGESAELLNLRAAAYMAMGNSLPFGGDDPEKDRQDPSQGLHWFGRAETDLRTALKLDGNYAPAIFNLALVLEGLERPDESKQMWNKVLQVEQREDVRQAVEKHLRGLP